ncbi:hypothetical protein MLD38_006989 [Melastoma candidum]|uniref:Uncharacterized protein n=1 Tax=Melastoma candidum TaxID=119954 RepID=A0ACB9RPE2_9MYRT|nr:hypothetical protein MLD38_006989 [Melastoma candidum]
MYRWERTMRDGGSGIRLQREMIPSFSSSLLDEVYRSIDAEGGLEPPRGRGFYADCAGGRKQSKCGTREGEVVVFDRIESVRAGALVEKRAKDRETVLRRQVCPEPEKKLRRGRDFDRDALFFSSASSFSDSSSNGFSSSDTESAYGGGKTRVSCFVPLPRQKPMRTSVATRSDKSGGRTEFSPFQEQRNVWAFDNGDEMNSEPRGLKIYSNLKKMKQPISPGGKLASFINSLFTANNTPRKAKQSAMHSVPYTEEENFDGKLKSGDSSACSSASSFSRSCLSKYSPMTREKLRNGSKRSVQFYPVSLNLDEDSQLCGQKSLPRERQGYEKQIAGMERSVSIPAARNSGTNVHRKIEDETRHSQRKDRSSQAEEAAREFLRNYHQNQKKIEKTANAVTITSRGNQRSSQHDHHNRDFDDDDDDDDAASCTSSDLFELDHLSVLGNDVYCKELPVYGTTRVGLSM